MEDVGGSGDARDDDEFDVLTSLRIVLPTFFS